MSRLVYWLDKDGKGRAGAALISCYQTTQFPKERATLVEVMPNTFEWVRSSDLLYYEDYPDGCDEMEEQAAGGGD